jgi:very-short-patch-repair endonuclease
MPKTSQKKYNMLVKRNKSRKMRRLSSKRMKETNKKIWSKKNRKKMLQIVANNCKLSELWKTKKFRKKHRLGCRTMKHRAFRRKEAKRIMATSIWKTNNRKALKERWNDNKYRQKMQAMLATKAKARWKTKKYRKIYGAHLSKLRNISFGAQDSVSGKFKPSKIQHNAFLTLRKSGIKGLRFEKQVDCYSLDIAHIPSQLDIAHIPSQLDIEIDGPSFHGTLRAKKHDRKRDRRLRSLGWRIIRLKAYRGLIKSDRFKVLAKELIQWKI